MKVISDRGIKMMTVKISSVKRIGNINYQDLFILRLEIHNAHLSEYQ